jgi:hypothetical protein
MLAIEGIYQNGKLILQETVEFTQLIKVIVTFIEEPKKMIDLNDFSFSKLGDEKINKLNKLKAFQDFR